MLRTTWLTPLDDNIQSNPDKSDRSDVETSRWSWLLYVVMAAPQDTLPNSAPRGMFLRRLRGPLIKIPDGLLTSDEPYEPDVRRFYWLEQPLLDPADPEPKRPAVVMALPVGTDGEIPVVTRSSTEKNGQFHPRYAEHGLNRDGWLTRLRRVSTELWTPTNAHSIDLLLDEETFSYVLRDFGL